MIELHFEKGLDVLAAYVDGRVRYLHHAEKLSIIDAPSPAIRLAADRVIDASKAIVQRIGPWEQLRLPPPKVHSVRMSFLVSDGLYFGEGLIATMQADAMAAPLLAAGTALLQVVIKETLDIETSSARSLPP